MRHLPLLVGIALGTQGCIIPVFAPPSSYAPPAPATTMEEPSTEIVGSLSIWPSLSAGHTVLLPDAPAILFDVRGQAGIGHIVAAPGLWIRTRGSEGEGFHFGARFGGAVGTGDLWPVLPFQMPYAGPSVYLQLAHGSRRRPLGAFSFTLGGEWLQPVAPAFFSKVVVDDDGTEATVIPLPIWYASVDIRMDIQAGEHMALVLGAGVDFPYTAYALPTGTLGFRF